MESTNSTKPTIQLLYSDDYDENIRLHYANINHRHYQNLTNLFSLYFIILPIFIICCVALVKFLRHRGYLSQSEAGDIAQELKSVRISMPNNGFMVPPPPPSRIQHNGRVWLVRCIWRGGELALRSGMPCWALIHGMVLSTCTASSWTSRTDGPLPAKITERNL